MRPEPKHELLVFNRKEVGLVLMILGLVALLSFTLGVRLGKHLGGHAAANELAAPPFGGGHEVTHEATHEEHGKGEHKAEHKDVAADEKAVDDKVAANEAVAAGHEAEKKADEALHKELEANHAGTGKKLPMAFPEDKKVAKAAASEEPAGHVVGTKTGKAAAGKYTLQVGSHRTQAEAVGQVKELKAEGFDAFYVEVQIPNKGTWYRVGMGVFATKEMAEKTAATWKKTKKLPSFIVQKVAE